MYKYLTLTVFVVFAMVAFPAVGFAQPAGGWTTKISDEKNLAWASLRDLTSAQFSDWFDHYRERGYMIIDVEAYPHGNDVRYAMVWEENTDGRGWVQYRNMTSEGYGERWRELRDRGYRPLDIEAYMVGGNLQFAGIWVENKEGLRWSSRRGMTGDQYAEYFNEQRAAGFRPIDIEVYQTSAGLRYAAIWYENRDNIQWAQLRDMTRERYQQETEERAANGFRVIDFESYQTSSGQRLAAIWEKPASGSAYQVRTDRSALDFANLWRQYRDEGYRLVDFERYDTPQGPRYGGIWVENNDRFRYARKGALDQAIEAYRQENDIPGISVAVIRNGQVIYQKGFGHADIAAQKVAHGQTIYNAASVSKVVGGTLAAKLEDEGRLRDGTRVDLDLTRATAVYLSDIPNHHTHQVDHLLAHLGCVAHYDNDTSPSIANQTNHYANAFQAVQSIWDTSLLTDPPCTVGQTRSYSTAAFTFVGAVLERATHRSIARLLDEEIAQPYSLDSMRAQWANATLATDYDRAVPYDDGNNPINYSNSSWKVLGGGIEMHAVDMAQFGWLVLNGNVVAANARDDRMWSPVRAGCGASTAGACLNGLAWELRTIGGRRVAEHSGRWSGARSFLRIYRDDGLVVAIMSNQRNHPIANLVTTIGNTVLDP